MKCPVCSSPLLQNDGIFVCEEGHIYKHAIEVVERTTGSHTTLDRTKHAPTKQFFPLPYARLIILSALFKSANKVFCVHEPKILRLFFWIVEKSEKNLNFIDSNVFFVLLYLEKRREAEEKGNILLLSSFMRYAQFFSYDDVLSDVSNRISGEAGMEWKRIGYVNAILNEKIRFICGIAREQSQTQWKLKMTWKDKMRFLRDIPKKIKKEKNNTETELYKKYSYEEKRNIYSNQFLNFCKNDVLTRLKYFKKIILDLNLEKNESLVFYTKKFIYTNVYYNGIVVPEFDICAFLCDYYSLIEKDVDWKQKIAFYLKNRNLFEDSWLETAGLRNKVEEYRRTNYNLVEKTDSFLHEGIVDCYFVFAYYLDVSKLKLETHCVEMRKMGNAFLNEFLGKH